MADARTLEADIIMKGGVTSGIVYPGAIARVARGYRLRSIGGTSAGAIAAAAAAAMEFGLQTGRNPKAIDQMAALTSRLAVGTSKGGLLLQLFAADAATRPVLDAALAGVNRGALAGVARLARWPLVAGIVAAAAAVGVAGFGLAGLLAAVGAFVLVLAVGLFLVLRGAVAAWARNGLGLATGMARSGATEGGKPVPSLTEWLHDVIQQMAGLPDDQPLCMGHLWNLDPATPASGTDPRQIDLVLVASDLNRLESVSFPYLPQNQRLFIDRAEWARLFPASVMARVAATAWPSSPDHADLPEGLGFTLADVRAAAADHPGLMERLMLIPRARDLPVLVAARASMAFPGLFTPLPLWLLRWRADEAGNKRPELGRVLLSDGGITSNFPIHLFDGAVPSRPTFALNLLYPGDEIAEERPPSAAGDRDDAPVSPESVRGLAGGDAPGRSSTPVDLFMPFTNRGRVNFYKGALGVTAFGQLAGLIGRVVETARTWGDVSLYNLPGVRDRIIHIRLSADEGGFNLDMPPDVINRLSEKGRMAGDVLARRFDPISPDDPLSPDGKVRLNWHNHRFVRLRTFIASQERLCGQASDGWARANDPARLQSVPALSTILASARGSFPADDPGGFTIGYSWNFTEGQRSQIGTAINTLATIPAVSPSDSATSGAPQPATLLKARPAGPDPRRLQR